METSTSLSVQSTTSNIDENVKLVLAGCYHKRLTYYTNLIFSSKVLSNVLAIYNNLACSFPQEYTGNGSLSSSCTNSDILNHNILLLDVQRLRILGGMGMLSSSINLYILQDCTSQRSLRQHSLDGQHQRSVGVALNLLLEGESLQSTNISSVVVIQLVVKLVSSYGNLISIDNNNKVTHFLVPSVSSLVLSSQNTSNLGCDPSQGLACCIDNIPVTYSIAFIHKNSLHAYTLIY